MTQHRHLSNFKRGDDHLEASRFKGKRVAFGEEPNVVQQYPLHSNKGGLGSKTRMIRTR